MRYLFEISYHGKEYRGWQKQKNAPSVQEEVENCFGTLLKEQVEITGSGRTDAGVHCQQQFFHTDVSQPLDEDFMHKINSFLPDTISIRSIHRVSDNHHARFDALSRRYHYSIHLEKEPFLTDVSLQYFRNPDFDLMNSAAATLIGDHDFKCFSKVKTDVHTYRCTILRANWSQQGRQWVFNIEANRFLRGMVRSIVGTLLELSEGRRTLDDFHSLLKSGDRKLAGPSVLAHGLTLMEVRYPGNYFNLNL